MIQAYNAPLVKYASKGWLVPLDGYIKKYASRYGLADLNSSAWDGFSYRGHVYGVPNQTNTQILMYRKDLFDKLGLDAPKTYADMMAAAKALRAADAVKYPMAMAWGADDALGDGFHSSLTANGGKWFDRHGAPAFDSAAGVKSLHQMRQMLRYAPPSTLTHANGDVMALMQQGLVGMTTIWASRAGPILDANQSRVADKVGFAPAPAAVPGGPPASGVSQDGFVIPRNSTVDPELLFRLMASTTTAPKVMQKAAPVAIPPRDSLVHDTKGRQPYWPAAEKTTKRGAQPLPKVPYMEPLTKSVVNPYLAKALTGRAESAAALASAARELDATLRSKGYLK
ncbi:putative arabinose-binding protein precursor [Streptomyces sp. YIM 130001]|nr:extracellular solute-binding protein [Streptomyces sp. YIM 130001]RII16086.1 putative arabinose-binding protein precursor [Streptomyces sp. YIM 130001]